MAMNPTRIALRWCARWQYILYLFYTGLSLLSAILAFCLSVYTVIFLAAATGDGKRTYYAATDYSAAARAEVAFAIVSWIAFALCALASAMIDCRGIDDEEEDRKFTNPVGLFFDFIALIFSGLTLGLHVKAFIDADCSSPDAQSSICSSPKTLLGVVGVLPGMAVTLVLTQLALLALQPIITKMKARLERQEQQRRAEQRRQMNLQAQRREEPHPEKYGKECNREGPSSYGHRYDSNV